MNPVQPVENFMRGCRHVEQHFMLKLRSDQRLIEWQTVWLLCVCPVTKARSRRWRRSLQVEVRGGDGSRGINSQEAAVKSFHGRYGSDRPSPWTCFLYECSHVVKSFNFTIVTVIVNYLHILGSFYWQDVRGHDGGGCWCSWIEAQPSHQPQLTAYAG